MELGQLESFLAAENRRLLESLPGLTEGNVALAQSVKLAEEAGELGAAVLATRDLQRERPVDDPPNVEMELADVVITALLLGDTLDVDIEAALSEKIARIEDRHE